MLIVFAGLPGTRKSTLARSLALELGAVWLRVDSIEQAIVESGVVQGPMNDAGYRAAHAVAADNLPLGRTVVGDCVNPWMLTRNAWRDVGFCAGVQVSEIEVICSDVQEHRRRVETRQSDIPGLRLPNWEQVRDRDYHAWDRAPLVIDTAGRTVADCVEMIRSSLKQCA